MMIPAGSAHLIRFGEFELDPRTRELRTNGHRLSLQEQPFQVLLALLERPGQLVTREELTKRLWPSGTFVDFDHSLNTAVNRLRGAVEDSAEQPRFIESLPRRGYRFVAPVTLDGPEMASFSPSRGPVSTIAAEIKEEAHSRVASPVSDGLSRKQLAIVSVSVLLLIAAIAAVIIHFRSSPRITARHSIVLADFTNTTGDPIFEGTLQQGLAVQLEQSPFLDIVSDDRIAQTLRLMGQPQETKLAGPIAKEICRRDGGSAWLDSSIANVEGEYVVGLRAVNCQNSEVLAQAQVTANNKKEVLKALSSAATQLRTKLGESLASMQNFDTPLDQATTPSLEALQAYSLGRKAMWRTEDANAALLFQRAILLDPNFALAYSSLGETYVNLGQTVLAAQNSKKAYDLRSQVSEREKLYIESHYLQNVIGNLDKARDVYELWAQTYPNDIVPRVNLAGIYVEHGQYDRALAEELEAFRIDPANGTIHADCLVLYIYLNRLDDAEATFRQAVAKNLDNPRLRTTTYVLYFLRNDDAGMMQQVSWGAGKPGVEEILFALEAETTAWRGGLTRASEFSRRAVASALGSGEKETAATYEVFSALHECLMGETSEARRHVAAALTLSTGRDVQAVAALALAFLGESAQSRNLARELGKNFPEDTIVQFNYLPTINAQLALNDKDHWKAIRSLETAASYELGDSGDRAITLALYPVYVRGQAYLAAGEGQQAAREFQKILDHPGVVQNRLVGVLARLGLARAYRLEGYGTQARTAYQDFFTLWKDADPDTPILKDAKTEYATLQ